MICRKGFPVPDPPSRVRLSLALLVALAAGAACGRPTAAKPPASEGEPAQTASPSAAEQVDVQTAGPVDVQRQSISVRRDLVYCTVDQVPLKCDLYLPAAAPAAALRPVVVVVHGGGWASGDKWTIGGYGQQIAEAGMAAVVVNYRLAPQHPFPAQVDDLRSALLWVADQADQYGWDLSRLGIYGYSAGAHLACMLGTLCDAPLETQLDTSHWSAEDPRWDRLPQPAAVAAGGAPCEFRSWPLDSTTLAYFLGATRRESPRVYNAASPASHASPGDCPTLFVHGGRDLIVPPSSSRALYDAQVAAGVPSEYVELDGHGHMVTFLHPTACEAVVRFLTHHLRP